MSAQSLILILEDEPLIGFALEDMLIELGYDVRLTTSIAEARKAMDQCEPLLAILDVNIRGDRSYEFGQMLVDRDLPVIFATGYGDAEHPLSLKGTPTLTKPYSLASLRSALDAVLG